MSYNNTISASDPQAVEKLTARLESCQKLHTVMKDTNAYWRKFGTCKGAPDISDEQAEKLERKIDKGYSWDKQPFSSYELTNNNAEIKRLERRIKEISFSQEVGFSGWNFEGGVAVANKEMNRLQLVFDEKPDEKQRAILKTNGFKWAPSQNAWQRQLNDNAIYAANRVDFIKPDNGKTVREMQPKQPRKDSVER